LIVYPAIKHTTPSQISLVETVNKWVMLVSWLPIVASSLPPQVLPPPWFYPARAFKRSDDGDDESPRDGTRAFDLADPDLSAMLKARQAIDDDTMKQAQATVATSSEALKAGLLSKFQNSLPKMIKPKVVAEEANAEVVAVIKQLLASQGFWQFLEMQAMLVRENRS
jgi:hypothetical protein